MKLAPSRPRPSVPSAARRGPVDPGLVDGVEAAHRGGDQRLAADTASFACVEIGSTTSMSRGPTRMLAWSAATTPDG